MSIADKIRDEMDRRGIYGGQKIDTLLFDIDSEVFEDSDEDSDEDSR